MKVGFGLVGLCQTNMVHEGLYVLGKGSYYTRAVRLHSMQLIPIYLFMYTAINIIYLQIWTVPPSTSCLAKYNALEPVAHALFTYKKVSRCNFKFIT